MLKNYPVITVLPATDIARAKDFYINKLGLTISNESGDYLTLEAGGGTKIMIYKRGEPTKAEHTVAGFRVDNLESVMSELKNKGVVFEEYDMPGLKTVNGVAETDGYKSAWFKDSEGNIIALDQG